VDLHGRSDNFSSDVSMGVVFFIHILIPYRPQMTLITQMAQIWTADGTDYSNGAD